MKKYGQEIVCLHKKLSRSWLMFWKINLDTVSYLEEKKISACLHLEKLNKSAMKQNKSAMKKNKSTMK